MAVGGDLDGFEEVSLIATKVRRTFLNVGDTDFLYNIIEER